MTMPTDSQTREEFERAERELMEYLGVSWIRQNSALTVHIYEPEFKLETLVPASKDYRAHFALHDAWKKMVKLMADKQSAYAAGRAAGLDWLTIATTVCLNCDITHDGEQVLPSELAKYMQDTAAILKRKEAQ